MTMHFSPQYTFDHYSGGILLISKPDFLVAGGNGTSTHLAGVLAGLGAAAASTSGFLFLRSLAGKEPAIVMATWYNIMSFAIAAVPTLLGYPSPAAWPCKKDWPVLGVLVMASFSCQVFLARGLTLLTPSKAAAINLLQVVYARILGTVFLHDAIEVPGITGSMLVVAGVLVANSGNDTNNNSQDTDAKEAQLMDRDGEEETVI